jgi:hypothetical protein
MLTTIAASKAPLRERPGTPLQAFALRDGAAAVLARAAEIEPRFWRETFRGQEKDLAYYELLERTMTAGCSYRYLLLHFA